MKFRAKLTIAMVLLLSLTYGIGGSLMIAQSFSSSSTASATPPCRPTA